MKINNNSKITISICIVLTLLFELTVGFLVSRFGGNFAFLRLIIQLVLLVGVLVTGSRIPIYIITFYHVIVGMQILTDRFEMMTILFGLYHIILGLIIYFNEEIDVKLKQSLL